MQTERAVLYVIKLQHPLPVRLSVIHCEVQGFVKHALTTSEVADLLDELEKKQHVILVRGEDHEIRAKLTVGGLMRLKGGE